MFAGPRALWLVAGFLVAAGLALIAYNYFFGDDGGGDFQVEAAPVVVEPASPYLFADIIEALGTAKANESVTVTAQVSDTVKEVHFEDGARVDEGTILVTLTNAEQLANVSAAVAGYTEAKQNMTAPHPWWKREPCRRRPLMWPRAIWMKPGPISMPPGRGPGTM